MNWSLRLLALAFVTVHSLAGWAAPPEKSVGIDAIRAYEGTWDITIDHLDTAQSKASHEKTALHNDCWKSGAYFACNQYVNGESKVLLVFTYNESKNEYTSYQIPQGGGASGSGKLLIDGNVWTFPWQVGEGAKATYFRVLNVFAGPDTIDFRQEFSTDQIHWTLMAKGSEHKAGSK
jgi:hypothetical protein